MKLSTVAVFAASLVGSASAMDLTYYGGVNCRGNEYYSETIYIGTRCRKFDGRKTNAASILTKRRGDPQEAVAAFYLSDNCSGGPVVYTPAGCVGRSQAGKRVQSVKVIESPFNKQVAAAIEAEDDEE